MFFRFNIMKTLEELQKELEYYKNHGFRDQANAAIRYAQIKTRAYIARTHPSTGFGGQSLITDEHNAKTHNQIIKGKFDVDAKRALINIYANYLARWYNTGAKQHMILRGERRGQLSTHYSPRGNYFESNEAAIKKYFASQIEEFIKRNIKM